MRDDGEVTRVIDGFIEREAARLKGRRRDDTSARLVGLAVLMFSAGCAVGWFAPDIARFLLRVGA